MTSDPRTEIDRQVANLIDSYKRGVLCAGDLFNRTRELLTSQANRDQTVELSLETRTALSALGMEFSSLSHKDSAS